MPDTYFKNKSFLKFSKQHQINILRNNYPLLFKHINFNSTDTDINNCVKKQEEYNNKNAKYLNLKEVDCNLNKKFNPFEYTINEPIILRGFYKDTIAFNKWNKDNLPQKFGKNKIKTEYYLNYLSLINHEVDCVKKYNMSQFLEKMNKEYLYIGETSIDHFKKNSLYDDLDNPRIKINDTFDTVVFCGNKNTGSHTHIHLQAYDYILNQVIGTKTMYLFDLNDNIDQNIGLSSPFNNSTRFIFDYKQIILDSI